MQRQHGELVPISEVVSGLDDVLVPAIREASPQSRHHFTRFDQVNQLVTASEADPDLGFMARLLALCSLPRTNPGNRHQYKRVNGPYKLILIAGGDNRLPYGNLPRLILAWVCTEAVRTQSRELVLGRSFSGFMRKLGMQDDSGSPRGDRTRLRNQMKRLFNASVQLIYEDAQNIHRNLPKGDWDRRKGERDRRWRHPCEDSWRAGGHHQSPPSPGEALGQRRYPASTRQPGRAHHEGARHH